jgi:hypothetical protein
VCGDPGDHGAVQRAILRTAQSVPVLILMAKDVFQTGTAQYILGPPTCDTLCRFAPIHNPAVEVTYVDTVVKRIDNFFSRNE